MQEPLQYTVKKKQNNANCISDGRRIFFWQSELHLFYWQE